MLQQQSPPASPSPPKHHHHTLSHHAAESRSPAPTFITLDPIASIASFFCHQQQPESPSPAPASAASAAVATRRSRKDHHLHSRFWPFPACHLNPLLTGLVPLPALPPFSYDSIMPTRGKPAVPDTRVTSPSPTPSEREAASSRDAHAGPVTRSATRKRLSTPQPVEEDPDEDSIGGNGELRRARSRSRSPINPRTIPPLTATKSKKGARGDKAKAVTAAATTKTAPNGIATAVPKNGYLSPTTATTGVWNWRDFSRSPSPLGLIPIHRHWRTFVHKHEVPRKALHVSIGFFVIWLYLSGTQTRAVCPYLMSALVPIAAVDVVRHHYEPFNRFYVRVLGALMRESEFAGYNGVIFYLLGAWTVLYFFPKDVGVMGTLLLSWCDTAASTFGRLFGRYTPRIRRGKSLAGSLAAFITGVATAGFFWGWLVPSYGPLPGDETFMFKGGLHLPPVVSDALGLAWEQSTISGRLALGVVSVWSGFVAAASEVVDVMGWDDNLTIPVLSGLGIWGFLKVFG